MHPLQKHILEIPNFPKEGILFQDLSPLLAHHFDELMESLSAQIPEEIISRCDVFAGIEARGFILASALAQKFKKGFVPIRKAGKLPPPFVQQKYALEYGEDTIEMHRGNGNLILVDDVLATGGTLMAARELSKKAGFEVLQMLCILNLKALNDLENKHQDLACLMHSEK